MYNFNGEIHTLNKDYFYIAEKYDDEKSFNEEFMKRKFLDKYTWYLFSVDFSNAQVENIINSPKDRFQFIHRKPCKSESLGETLSLNQCGTYCMKFKKINKYNLDLEKNAIQ